MNTVSSHCLVHASLCFYSQPLDGQCDDGLHSPERLRGFLLRNCKGTHAPGA